VTSLREADMVEVIVDDGKNKRQTHVDVNYTVGDQTFKTRVRRTATMAEFRESTTHMHTKGNRLWASHSGEMRSLKRIQWKTGSHAR
jgi:hypothetical protein